MIYERENRHNKTKIEPKKIITKIRLKNRQEGPVLVVIEPKNEMTEKYFPSWSTPLSHREDSRDALQH